MDEAAALHDLWSRAVLALSDASSENLAPVLQELTQASLPLAEKYREVDVLSVLRDNASQQGLNAIATAFNILEKYGRNLLSQNKPKFWRAVKFNNPVFKSTVDAVKGGREILRLYGYTVELRDGLSFPEDVAEPDRSRVATVTVEVALLQVELDLLRKGMHPHPELFSQLLSARTQTPLTPGVQDLRPVADSPAPTGMSCAVCSAEQVSCFCQDCRLLFCRDCGDLYHRHPARAQHHRSPTGTTHREVQNGEVVSPGKEPESKATPSQTLAWSCPACQLSNPGQLLVCQGCQLPRAGWEPPPPSRVAWSCQACTCLNEASSVLCSACDRPRLAGRPSFTPRPPASSITPAPDPLPAVHTGKRDPAGPSGWECRHCTYINLHRERICEMCDRTSDPREGEGEGKGVPRSPVTTAQPSQDGLSAELERQRAMKEDGLRLITAIRMAEQQQLSPEEVVCALRCAGDVPPLTWLETGLPQVLECVSELALQQGGPAVGLVGREEAHQAWLSCGGSLEEAARCCARERRRKVGEMEALGFVDREEVLQALYTNGGDIDRALVDLQGRRLQPFHNRIWQEHQEPVQLQLPDKERVLRQILATYSLQSWGRAEIVLSLMQEDSQHYELADVVDAVKESADREFIKRCLSLQCPICFSLYPRSKAQSLTSCECTICLDCFKEYFTLTVREKNIKNLVCPICSKPDIDDEAQRLSYFSTLDVQLRDCLDTDDYNLFHKKLTERTLMMDPKFKWCTHCSNGFIYDGNQKQVTCPQCQGSFCVECKRPWEPQHQGISCEEFQTWKRENDPEYQAQGLAAYLKENGIDCPKCKFRYALARGGCMHFTCSQCQYEFCSGCYNAFLGKKKCNDPACRLKDSLHAHHPRDCLSYLRDWPVRTLQELLQRHRVNFDTVPPAGAEATPGGNCRVMEQREEQGKLTDEACGKEACQGHAGLCESHYKEYLVSRINGHSLDPAVLYTVEEMEVILGRLGKKQADRALGETEAQYKARLLKVITATPLGDKVPRIRK